MTEEQLKLIGEVAHEVNRAYCQALGDDSQPPWSDVPEWQVLSLSDGIKYNLENDSTPRETHDNWMRFKESDGWVYGEVKDPIAKTHPCMVPYDDLPIEQKVKDYLFKAVVRTMAKQFTM